ncbi:hypothetical protein RhiirC2_855091 [Rhizophagus irregularis]|uniref:Uncharacterized protein n=1 Tax=Rhizophagus irregularis TaxID=588596 RepID=A0A2N1MNW4_9GLOM|nr:hypothetical protein RhiirC2_855091 [Rhizophagus irregularis]
MAKFISNIPRYVVSYKYGRIEVFRYAMTETVDNRPGYDMGCIYRHLYHIFNARAAATGCGYREVDNWTHELIETEKEFDRLSIVKPGQTLTSWAINVSYPVVQGCNIIKNTKDSFIKQLYNQKSYSEHKKHQLRLGANNAIQDADKLSQALLKYMDSNISFIEEYEKKC